MHFPNYVSAPQIFTHFYTPTADGDDNTSCKHEKFDYSMHTGIESCVFLFGSTTTGGAGFHALITGRPSKLTKTEMETHSIVTPKFIALLGQFECYINDNEFETSFACCDNSRVAGWLVGCANVTCIANESLYNIIIGSPPSNARSQCSSNRYTAAGCSCFIFSTGGVAYRIKALLGKLRLSMEFINDIGGV